VQANAGDTPCLLTLHSALQHDVHVHSWGMEAGSQLQLAKPQLMLWLPADGDHAPQESTVATSITSANPRHPLPWCCGRWVEPVHRLNGHLTRCVALVTPPCA
jgi:hypothetical protein